MFKREYRYFISYIYWKGAVNGFGSVETQASAKIKNSIILKQVSDLIAKDEGFDKVVILNFQRY